MTATLSMVPVAQIRPSKANPRAEFDDERMAELIESVKQHGIITPLMLSRDGDGRYAIIAGERRYRAATRRTAGVRCGTPNGCARQSQPLTARPPTSRTSPARAGVRCKP